VPYYQNTPTDCFGDFAYWVKPACSSHNYRFSMTEQKAFLGIDKSETSLQLSESFKSL